MHAIRAPPASLGSLTWRIDSLAELAKSLYDDGGMIRPTVNRSAHPGKCCTAPIQERKDCSK